MINNTEIEKRIQDSYELENNVLNKVPQPMVTVRTSTYQHAAYIKDCIESVLMQKTNFDFEFIIGEDFSTDGTREIVFDYAKKYPEIIRVITADYNVGMFANGTRCIRAYRGKYIAMCEGDDYWTDPYKLQKQVDFMEANPDCVLTYHAWVEKHGEEFRKPKKMFCSTHTRMFKNITDEFKEHLNIPVTSGDTLLKFLLKHYGNECFVDGIEPAVKRRDSGGVWNKLSFEQQQKSKLHTAELMVKELRKTKFETRAKNKFVQALIVSNRQLRAKQLKAMTLSQKIKLVLKYGVGLKYLKFKLINLKSNLLDGK